MSNPLSRRRFVQTSAVAVAGFPALVSCQNVNSRLQIAAVGVSNKGLSDVREVGSHPKAKFVAFCDIDTSRFGGADAAFPGTPHYADFREMYDKLGDKFDAVTVSTPDHMHALPALLAMRRRKHVYLQKPLTHSVAEARLLTEEAARMGVQTRMGNQIHSRTEYRTAVKLIQSGRIGKVKEVHSWHPNPGNRYTNLTGLPASTAPVPQGLSWDLWLGVAPARPFSPDVYHPFKWRDWLDFGCGTLGDFGCHIYDPVFCALELTKPLTIKADSVGVNDQTWCSAETITYVYPGTKYTAGDTITMTWHDGGRKPDASLAQLPKGKKLFDGGSMFIGTEGVLLLPHVGTPVLLPEEKYGTTLTPGEEARRKRALDRGEKVPAIKIADIQAEESLNHYHGWVDAALTGVECTDNFAYAGPLTEAVLLGTIASRFPGASLKWDADALKIANHKAANALVRKEYRDGWKV